MSGWDDPAVREKILATGAVTEKGIGRKARATICRKCHAPTIRGLDADICAFDVSVDPQPVDLPGEVLALAAGRASYDLVGTGGALVLERREARHIRHRRYPVLVTHRCGAPPVPTPTVVATAAVPTSPPF